jgi:hypothetical protein
MSVDEEVEEMQVFPDGRKKNEKPQLPCPIEGGVCLT